MKSQGTESGGKWEKGAVPFSLKVAGKKEGPGFPGPWATSGELTAQPSTKLYYIIFPAIVKGLSGRDRTGRHQPFLKNVGPFLDAAGTGVEPASLQLTADCSTIELPGNVLPIHTAISPKMFPREAAR